MRKLFRSSKKFIIFFCVFSCFFFTSCSSGTKENPYKTPEATLEEFEAALNEGDLGRAFSCFDENVAKVLSGGHKIVSSVLGIDLSNLFDLAMGLYGMSDIDYLDGAHYDITSNSISYSEDETSCTVSATLALYQEDSIQGEETGEIPMVLEGDQWKVKLTLKDIGL